MQMGNSACYAVQVALKEGAREIALIGVDYNSQVLKASGSDSHFYGENALESKRSSVPDQEILFWQEAKKQGAACLNLSPYESTPFNDFSEWQRETWESYCAR